jgi:hypothetical protein
LSTSSATTPVSVQPVGYDLLRDLDDPFKQHVAVRATLADGRQLILRADPTD